MKKIVFTDKTPAYVTLSRNNCGALNAYESVRSVTSEVTDCPVCCETKVITLGQQVVKSKIGGNQEKYRWLRARVNLTKDCNFPTIDPHSLRINVGFKIVGRYSGEAISEGEVSRVFSPEEIIYPAGADFNYALKYQTFFHLEQKVEFPVNPERGMQIRTEPVAPEDVTFYMNRVYITGYTYPMYGLEDENVFRDSVTTTKEVIVDQKHFILYDSKEDDEFSPAVFSVSSDMHKIIIKFDIALENLYEMDDYSKMEDWIEPLEEGETPRTWEDVMQDTSIPGWLPKPPKPPRPPRPPKPHIPPVIHIPIGVDLDKVNNPPCEPTINIPTGPHDDW